VLRINAPAKVNLHLSIGPLRADGYHRLEGVFHTLELSDVVLIEPAESLAVSCDAELGVEPRHNLAHRAAVAMGEAFGAEPRFRIALTKRIPHGAGLGGGSSDAAAVIAGLAALWGTGLDDPRCLDAAASVGADVPFFLVRGGCALMGARGDRLERLLPSMEGVPVALVRPQQPVPTAAAYAAFDADPKPGRAATPVVEALQARDAARLASALFNNMESASCTVVPAVAEAIAWTRSQEGVAGAVVAGSGSAVFAIVDTGERAHAIAGAARSRGWWGAATRLAGEGVRVHDDTRGEM